MLRSLKIVLFFFVFFSVNLSFSQVKKLDKLEQIFDQGLYKKVERKSSKYLIKYFPNHPSPLLFHALSEYYLGDSRKYSKSDGILEFEKFLKLDSTQKYRKMYANYINDFHDELINEIRELKNSGKTKKAEIRFATLQRLFSENASYEEIISSGTEEVTENNTNSSSNSNQENSSSSSTGESNTSTSAEGNTASVREGIVVEAKKHIGTPYKYGGTNSKGFDCSGYTQYVMAKNSVSIPRTSTAQATSYRKIKATSAMPGDLVFFGSSKNKISHVGIIISNPGEELTMIHASTSRGVMITKIGKDPYWQPKMQFIARVIED